MPRSGRKPIKKAKDHVYEVLSDDDDEMLQRQFRQFEKFQRMQKRISTPKRRTSRSSPRETSGSESDVSSIVSKI